MRPSQRVLERRDRIRIQSGRPPLQRARDEELGGGIQSESGWCRASGRRHLRHLEAVRSEGGSTLWSARYWMAGARGQPRFVAAQAACSVRVVGLRSSLGRLCGLLALRCGKVSEECGPFSLDIGNPFLFATCELQNFFLAPEVHCRYQLTPIECLIFCKKFNDYWMFWKDRCYEIKFGRSGEYSSFSE